MVTKILVEVGKEVLKEAGKAVLTYAGMRAVDEVLKEDKGHKKNVGKKSYSRNRKH